MKNNENESVTVSVILVAAGQSKRFSHTESDEPAVKKPFASLAGKPVWLHCAELFSSRDEVSQLIIVVAPDDLEWFFQYYTDEINRLLLLVVAGGKERCDSVRNALAVVRNTVDYVAIHDAARPCVTKSEIDNVFRQAKIDGAAMLATPIVGTIKRVQDGQIVETVDRTNLWEAQTPQVFRREIILSAYKQAEQAEQQGKQSTPTDDAQLVEKIGYSVSIVPGERSNIKITTQADLTLAKAIILKQN